MTKPVLFSFMSGSGLSDLCTPPPPPRQYHFICTVYARVGEGGVREGHGPWVTPARALVFLNML